jgi:tRNA(Ile)-lysidine synthase TilS/MesJ
MLEIRETGTSKVSCSLNIPCITEKKTKSEEEKEGNFSSLESLARKSRDSALKKQLNESG